MAWYAIDSTTGALILEVVDELDVGEDLEGCKGPPPPLRCSDDQPSSASALGVGFPAARSACSRLAMGPNFFRPQITETA